MPTHSTIDPIEAAAKALHALLTSIEHALSPAAVVAFKAPIARHGRSLHTTAGPEALAEALAEVA